MNLTNQSYIILLSTKAERYYHTKTEWVKQSMRGENSPPQQNKSSTTSCLG